MSRSEDVTRAIGSALVDAHVPVGISAVIGALARLTAVPLVELPAENSRIRHARPRSSGYRRSLCTWNGETPHIWVVGCAYVACGQHLPC